MREKVADLLYEVDAIIALNQNYTERRNDHDTSLFMPDASLDAVGLELKAKRLGELESHVDELAVHQSEYRRISNYLSLLAAGPKLRIVMQMDGEIDRLARDIKLLKLQGVVPKRQSSATAEKLRHEVMSVYSSSRRTALRSRFPLALRGPLQFFQRIKGRMEIAQLRKKGLPPG